MHNRMIRRYDQLLRKDIMLYLHHAAHNINRHNDQYKYIRNHGDNFVWRFRPLYNVIDAGNAHV